MRTCFSPSQPVLEAFEPRWLLAAAAGPRFREANLVSDIRGSAAHTDPAVVSPWGFTETPGGQFLLSVGDAFGNGEGGAGTKTLFFASGINDEENGLFGSVKLRPTPATTRALTTAAAPIAPPPLRDVSMAPTPTVDTSVVQQMSAIVGDDPRGIDLVADSPSLA
jgi:hypothetical protein